MCGTIVHFGECHAHPVGKPIFNSCYAARQGETGCKSNTHISYGFAMCCVGGTVDNKPCYNMCAPARGHACQMDGCPSARGKKKDAAALKIAEQVKKEAEQAREAGLRKLKEEAAKRAANTTAAATKTAQATPRRTGPR